MFSLFSTSLNFLSSVDFSASAWPLFSLLKDENPVSVPPLALDLNPLAWIRKGEMCPSEVENSGLLELFSLGEVMAVTAVEKSASQVGEEVSKGREISLLKTSAECEDRARTSVGVRLSRRRAASAQLVEAVLPGPWSKIIKLERKIVVSYHAKYRVVVSHPSLPSCTAHSNALKTRQQAMTPTTPRHSKHSQDRL